MADFEEITDFEKIIQRDQFHMIVAFVAQGVLANPNMRVGDSSTRKRIFSECFDDVKEVFEGKGFTIR